MHYNYRSLVNTYRQLGISKGDTVIVKSDLTRLGGYEKKIKHEILADHVAALDETIDFDKGTLVVATSSTNLIGTSKIYDPNNTPSIVGILTDYIRKLPGAVRSFHAFESYTALGKHASEICHDVSRHAYGTNTPEHRLISKNAICVSLGKEINKTCATVHHLEAICAVPYRYVKEYNHPVRIDNDVKNEIFYRHVWYRDVGIIRDTNVKLFHRLVESGLEIKQINLGNSFVQAISLAQFYEIGVKEFIKDPYVWLNAPPKSKPWTK